MSLRNSFLIVCFLDGRYVGLSHVEDGVHRPLRSFRAMIAEQFGDRRWDDLPRKAKLVFQPAALLCLWIASGGKFLPKVIHVLLCVAHDLKGDRLVELEVGSAVESRV